jgi:hypothetical protein
MLQFGQPFCHVLKWIQCEFIRQFFQNPLHFRLDPLRELLRLLLFELLAVTDSTVLIDQIVQGEVTCPNALPKELSQVLANNNVQVPSRWISHDDWGELRPMPIEYEKTVVNPITACFSKYHGVQGRAAVDALAMQWWTT